jgi:hypothetical protein
VLVYPVTVRDRPVCILYADNGDAPVSPGRLGDLLLFLSALGTAFERIIKQRKGGSRRHAAGGAAHAEPPRSGKAAASAPVSVGGPAAAPVQAAPEAPTPQEEPPPEKEPPQAEPPREEPPAKAPPQEEPPPEEAVADSLAALDGRSFGTAAVAAANGEPQAAVAVPPEGSSPAPAPGADAPPVAGPPDPAALAALADRVLDPDPDVASAACAALGARRRDQAVRHAVEKLRRALLSGISARASRAARAIGAVRDVESIPLLIQALETSEPETAKAAADALATITLQRLGPDARRWLGWWKENRGRGRAEWLFSGLTSPDRETRIAASVELSIAAPPPVAYSADLPAEDREKAARAWAGWWSRSGHVL